MVAQSTGFSLTSFDDVRRGDLLLLGVRVWDPPVFCLALQDAYWLRGAGWEVEVIDTADGRRDIIDYSMVQILSRGQTACQ